MSRGHHFTKCRYCLKEYVCRDWITSECELGRDKKACPGFRLYLSKEAAAAAVLRQVSETPGISKKSIAGAALLSELHLGNIVREMSNTELAEAVLKELWANTSMGTREEVLLSEVIERLRNKFRSASNDLPADE